MAVLLCTLIVLYLQCIFTFMNCFHVKTSLTYWVLLYSNYSNIYCCFCIWAKGIRTIEKQSSRALNVPIVLILFWALYEERDFHFHYQMVYTLPETMCTSTSSVTYTVSRPKQTHGIWREGMSISWTSPNQSWQTYFPEYSNIFFNGKDKIWIGCTNWRLKMRFFCLSDTN